MPALTALPATLSPRRLSLSLLTEQRWNGGRQNGEASDGRPRWLWLQPGSDWKWQERTLVTGAQTQPRRGEHAPGFATWESEQPALPPLGASAANCKGHVELFKKMRCDSHRSWETLPHCTHTQIFMVLNGKLFKNYIFSLLLNIHAPEWGCCNSTYRRRASVWHHKGLYREDRDAILVRKFCITWDL